MTLQEFADQHKENYDLIKEVLTLGNEIHRHRFENTCAVCDKELTPEEKKALHPSHFNYTCKEHAEYASCYMLDKIRKELGFEPQKYYMNID